MIKSIVILGTDWISPGGITAVLQSYKEGGLFQQWPIRFLPTYRSANPLNKLGMALLAAGRLLMWLLAGKVAVVHAHSASRASFWRKASLLCLARCFGAKTIFHLHSGEFAVFYHQECGALGQRFIRWVLRSVDVVVVLSERWVAVLQAIEPQCRPIALPNPIELPDTNRTPIEKRILFLGRLRDKKGVYDLVKAFKGVLGVYPDSKLVLAGDGELDAVAQLANDLGIKDQLILTGWIAGEAKQRELECADLFVLPSYFEGLPVCILEAMAYGIPVISTTVGGIPDICRSGVDGILFEAGDIAALQAAILKIFSDSDFKNSLVSSAKGRIQNEFEMNIVLSQLGDVYRNLGVVSLKNEN